MREDGLERGFILGKTPGAQRILLYDDFEDLFKWSVLSARWRPAIQKDAGYVYDGSWALRIWTGNTILNSDYECVAYRGCPLGVSSRVRLECVFFLNSPDQAVGVGLGFYDWADGYNRKWGILWGRHSPNVWYYSAAGTWEPVLAAEQYLAKGAWHRWAVEVDIFTQRYMAVELDGKRYDFSDYEFYMHAALLPTLGVGVRLSAWVNGAGTYTWFDNVLVRCL